MRVPTGPMGCTTIAITLVLASGCAATTKYAAPVVETPATFKENANWKVAQPSDAVARGRWWELFGDADLNALEQRIDVSNQTLKAAEARFAEARAIVRGNRSRLFPTVDAAPSIARTQPSRNRATGGIAGSYADIVLPVDASYEADVWGRIRGTLAASRLSAQATAADLEAARLSIHAELAVDYFALRGIDGERQLLASAVDAFEKALELTQNRFRGGIASRSDCRRTSLRPRVCYRGRMRCSSSEATSTR